MRAGVLSLVVLLGCSTDTDDVALLVDLRTDYSPGIDFFGVTTGFVNETGIVTEGQALPAFLGSGDAFIDGRRVAELVGVQGEISVEVSLLDRFGAVIDDRTVRVTVSQTTAVTVVISRTCRNRDCPGAGDDPLATECRGSLCVDPRCAPELPELCPEDECRTDGECVSAPGGCANAVCVSGVCLFRPDDGVCSSDERCDVELGCVPLPGQVVSGCQENCTQRFDSPGIFTYEVPRGCGAITAKVWGAGGGQGERTIQLGAAGGYGQATWGADAATYQVVVGGPGQNGVDAMPGAGGMPGGGGAGGGGNFGGGGGGGFSGIFDGAIDQTTAWIIAGGGGGSGGAHIGTPGAGGGMVGQAADNRLPTGGTQTEGGMPSGNVAIGVPGSALQGGAGGDRNDGGGGGGGGYFGGGGASGADNNARGGGGGSGYARPEAVGAILIAGDGRTPAQMDDPDRGLAADPSQPGRVILFCE